MAADANIEVRVFTSGGGWPDHTLVQLYTWTQSDETPSIFWRDGIPLSLNDFIRTLTDPGRSLIVAFLRTKPEYMLELEDIIGWCWMDEFEPPHAAVHFWVRKKHWWRERPFAAAWKILELIFREIPALHLVLCRANSDNRLAVKFIKKMGAHIVGEIPGWYQHGPFPYAALLSYITRSDVEARATRAQETSA